ncbi:MAG TPA: hypothetical protein VJ547_02455 [Candidatus Thermoplasmatota archaeon]|nr:hypothetical protein [Candidatus Thermoplasmatota archaeon]
MPGKYLFQPRPRGETTVVESQAARGAAEKFEEVVARVKAAYWPQIWMEVEIPREEAGSGARSVTAAPVTVSVRELPQVDLPSRYEGSAFYEATMSTPVGPLIDVEREEEAEQGLHWFATQVFLPFFISREALFGKADFDESGAREVTPRHLEELKIPDFYFLNILGAPFVRKFGLEPFQNPKINPPSLQRRWMMRTPEGALVFRAKVEADRWNGPSEPPTDFYDWEGRFRIIEKIEPKKKPRGLP